jgi:hypothetical protein
MGYISKKTELNLGDELVPTLSNPSNCWELSLGRWYMELSFRRTARKALR